MGQSYRYHNGELVRAQDLEALQEQTEEASDKGSDTDPQSFEDMSRKDVYAVAKEVSEDASWSMSKEEMIALIEDSEEDSE